MGHITPGSKGLLKVEPGVLLEGRRVKPLPQGRVGRTVVEEDYSPEPVATDGRRCVVNLYRKELTKWSHPSVGRPSINFSSLELINPPLTSLPRRTTLPPSRVGGDTPSTL